MNFGVIIARFKEPSTWAALASIIGVFGVTVAPEMIGKFITIGALVAGFLGVVIPEKSA